MSDSTTALAALIIAGYAALISTVTGLVQVFGYRRDRVRVRVAVGYKMQIIGDPRYEGQALTIVNVMNTGRRPVTINSIGGWRLYPHNPFVIPQTAPDLPCELTEGKSVRAIMPPCDMDFSTIAYWEACDATAHTYKLNVAPWYARAISNVRWRLEWRREHKMKKRSQIAKADG